MRHKLNEAVENWQQHLIRDIPPDDPFHYSLVYAVVVMPDVVLVVVAGLLRAVSKVVLDDMMQPVPCRAISWRRTKNRAADAAFEGWGSEQPPFWGGSHSDALPLCRATLSAQTISHAPLKASREPKTECENEASLFAFTYTKPKFEFEL